MPHPPVRLGAQDLGERLVHAAALQHLHTPRVIDCNPARMTRTPTVPQNAVVLNTLSARSRIATPINTTNTPGIL